MREIKFRAWDKVTRQFVTSFTMTSNGHIELWVGDGSGKVREPQDFDVLQYTGLKDKNGVEIYEGDLLRHYNGLINELYEVKWSSEDTCYTVKLQGRFIDPEMSDPYTDEQIVQMQLTSDVKYLMVMYSLSAMSGEAEVIGNIYENPELLEKSND